MSWKRGNSKFKLGDIKKLIFVVAFFCFIAVPSIQMLTNFVDVGEVESFDEKRKMATWDEIETSSMDTIVATFENYYKDNFGFRDLLISLNNRWKVQHFKISPSESVIIGKEGWYFLDAANSVNDHTGRVKLEPNYLKDLKANLLYKKEYIEKQGGKFYLVVLPDKMSVYSRHMPKLERGSNVTRFDQILDYCKGSGVQILDIRPAMIKAGESDLIYQKTDSHWNNNGGFIAYQEIMKRLKKDFPSVEYYNHDQYNITESVVHTGDLTTLVGVMNYEDNLQFAYAPKQGVYNGKMELLEKYQNYKLGYKATFSYFNSTLKQPKLMVMNDSYINYIHSFLGDHFSESHYFWTQNFDESTVDEIQPNIFIQLIVERSLESIVKWDK